VAADNIGLSQCFIYSGWSCKTAPPASMPLGGFGTHSRLLPLATTPLVIELVNRERRHLVTPFGMIIPLCLFHSPPVGIRTLSLAYIATCRSSRHWASGQTHVLCLFPFVPVVSWALLSGSQGKARAEPATGHWDRHHHHYPHPTTHHHQHHHQHHHRPTTTTTTTPPHPPAPPPPPPPKIMTP
jgi:hypothetical protein